MERNSELQDIARQLRELSARLEALMASEQAEVKPSLPEQKVEPTAEPEADAVAEPATEPVVEPMAEPEVRPALPLSVNDRYRFQREIFGGSAEQLNAALEALARMTSPGEVEDYFAECDFDIEADAVKDFLRLATRRFDAHPPLIV